MRLGLTIDSACDLPASFIDKHKIVVIPINIQTAEQTVQDARDESATQKFYASGILARDYGVLSQAYDESQISQFFLENVVQNFDFNLVQTIMQSRSPIFDNASRAAHKVLSEYRSIRAKEHKKPFSMRVVDTGTMFTGQGVIAAETVRIALSNLSRSEMRRRVELLASQTYAYAVMPDISYVRERARRRGDKSISFVSAFIGKAMNISPILCAHQGETFPVAKIRGFENAVKYLCDYIEKRIYSGLISPYIMISYAGNVADIDHIAGIDRLKNVAKANNIQVLSTVMSITAGANLGAGTLSIAICDKPHKFADIAA